MKIINEKKQIIKFIVFLLILTGITVFVHFDSFLYTNSILKVVKSETEYEKTTEGNNSEEEIYYKQTLTGILQNGMYKGETVIITNEYAYSLVKTEKYEIGDFLFVNIPDEFDGTASVEGVKRDTYVMFFAVLFILLIIGIAKKQGVRTICSVLVNIGVFVLSIYLYTQKNISFYSLFIGMVFVFSVITLIILGGISKKTLAAILSTLLTLGITYGIYQWVINNIEAPPYELMDFVVSPNDLEKIFLAGIIVGCLGAVMDVAITINSSVEEILETSEYITTIQLIKSVREIGYDIMGTMVNVLFFTYLSGSMPGLILKIKSGYTLYAIIKFNIIFEITRFLVGGIGIILAIPVSGFVAVILLKKGGLMANVKSIKHIISGFNGFGWRRKGR